MRRPRITLRHVKLLVALAVLALGTYILFTQGKESLEYPLLGHHCMKNSKAVEVSYNLVRYKDPLSNYVDYQATPKNPRGRRGSIFRYESPLSAFLLAGLYLVVDGKDFMTRVNTARYYTLLGLIAAYLIIGFFIFRRDIFALTCFTFFLATSFFAVSYSTKPQAETFSILYQSIALVAITALVRVGMGPFFKSLVIVGIAGLLCMGGKMNYFIIAAPVVAVYPFLDSNIVGVARKLKFYALFIGVALAGIIALKLFTNFSFYSTFIFFIKGNKPLLEDGLWKTFMEGFDSFGDVWERTREHFGSVVFGAGVYSTLYLAFKFVYLFIRKSKVPTTPFETFQMVLFLFIVGHALNYIVLRNLYIPHRYYVVPLFIIFCAAFAACLADLRSLALGKNRLLDYLLKKWDQIKTRRPLDRVNMDKGRVGHFGAFWKVTVLVFALSHAAGYLAYELVEDVELKKSFVGAFKYFGSTELSYLLGKKVAAITAVLDEVSRTLLWISVIFFAVNLLVFFMLSKNTRVQRAFSWTNRLLKKIRITAAASVLGAILLVVGALTVVQNGGMYYEEDNWQQDKIELADALEKIRNDTKSGDLVLCWKWCYAFYADKRSITDAKETDIDYYWQNRLYSVLGPKRPLNVYYHRVRKYRPPATLWRLNSDEEIERVKKTRIERGVFGKPVR